MSSDSYRDSTFTQQGGLMYLYFYEGVCYITGGPDAYTDETDADQILFSVDFTPHLTEADENAAALLTSANSMDIESRSPGSKDGDALLERMLGFAFDAGRKYERNHFSKYWLGWVYDEGNFSQARLYAARFGPFDSLQEAVEFQRHNPNLALIAVKEGE